MSDDTEVERLRAQNHEHAALRDREMADLRSRLDRWENAAKRARAMVRGTPVDWTNDPPSQEPDGWWNYVSVATRNVLIAAVHDLIDDDSAAERRFLQPINPDPVTAMAKYPPPKEKSLKVIEFPREDDEVEGAYEVWHAPTNNWCAMYKDLEVARAWVHQTIPPEKWDNFEIMGGPDGRYYERLKSEAPRVTP
jgi:hypothetical protein